MTAWTGEAHLLADAIREPGLAAAALNAAAWSAGVNPEATAGLIGAATTLTSGDCGPQLWAQAEPVSSDQELLTATTELEGAVGDLLKYATAMAQDCRSALQSAQATATKTAADVASAKNSQAPGFEEHNLTKQRRGEEFAARQIAKMRQGNERT